MARHAVPLLLREGDARPGTTSVVPRPVAHGPTSLFMRGGTHVIRTPDAWREFWQQLPTRLPPPDIDFDRVTLLAVVLDDDSGRVPEVAETRTEGDELVVRWRTAPTAPGPGATASRRPFVVVGVLGHGGSVRFEPVQ